MALTPEVRTTQATIRTISDGGEDLRVSQSLVRSIYNIPTENVRLTQVLVRTTLGKSAPFVRASQSLIRAIVLGRVDDPKIRVWTFTLDGHDFYVLRLGNNETLIYDLTTEQWAQWTSADQIYWSVFTGTNWVGGNRFSSEFGSNIIVGSDSNGSLFFLDPEKPDDDSVVSGRNAVPFRRRLTGQLVTRGYDYTRVYEVQLLGSIGQLDLGADLSIDLQYSDDRGDNYVSAGAIATQENAYDVRASWRSLGSFTSPGRLFRIEDFGALKRVDSLTVSTSNDPEG